MLIQRDIIHGATIAGGRIEDLQGPMYPLEDACISNAVEKRQLEFRAGRTAARQALEAEGAPAIPILVGHYREPRWPRGYIGSITHCDSLCYAVASAESANRGIGIDIEEIGRLTEDLWHLVFTSTEICCLRAAPNPAALATVHFSAKESFFKAQFPLIACISELKQIEVQTFPNQCLSINIPHIGLATQTSQHFYLSDGSHVFTAIVISHQT